MSGVDLRLQTLRRAIGAFRDTPGRQGRFIDLQDIEDVLVAGDMHGHVEHFRRILQKSDLANHPRRHLVLQELIHGPFRYPTGGDKSHQLVDLICALKAQFPHRVHYLMGNHELAQLTRRRVLKHDDDLNEVFLEGVRAAYGSRGDDVYALYMELFAIAPLALRTPNRLYLSHSLPSAGSLLEFDPAHLREEPTPEGYLRPGGSVYSLVWGRDVRPETLDRFLRKVDADYLVSGHIPCEFGYERPSARHIIIDTQGASSAYLLLPAAEPLTEEQFGQGVRFL